MVSGRSRAVSRIVLVALFTVGSAVACSSSDSEPTPGADGSGDPFYRRAGNGGYDVEHYDVDLSYEPGSGALTAQATLEASATQDLSSFNLDYRGPGVRSVAVDGRSAEYERVGPELVVHPDAPIDEGSDFVVEVAYAGRPSTVRYPDGSKDGWFRTDDGAVALGEPLGTTAWLPCNNALTDKATFAFRVEVPAGLEAVANGALESRDTEAGSTTWSWRADDPMAAYLATVAIGEFELDRSPVAGIESVVAVDPRMRDRAEDAIDAMPDIIDLFSELFGPYPFGQTGAIVDRAPVGFALETQTRPVYDKVPGAGLVAHELAHQWFGDSVGLAQWPDMWLNEGFATWAQWRWQEEAGHSTTAQQFDRFARQPATKKATWDPPPGAIPDPGELFAISVYHRGAMTLEALRQRVGDETFYEILRTWAADHAGGTATIDEFIALAEETSGDDLGRLFDKWLYQPGKP
jgi:aminopeptidase N